MPNLLREFIPVNYIWIGPPSSLPGSSGVSGHDVSALTALWQRIAYEKKHQIFFWCLDEFVPYYQHLLQEYISGDNPIQICSIEAYLNECMERECVDDLNYEEEINHDALLVRAFFKLFLDGKISATPIVDRVSCKELFSLFLLRSIGGFYLDTNVSPHEETAAILPRPEVCVKFMLPAFFKQYNFKQWMGQVNARLPWNGFESWAMYSSGENEITRPMVRKFIYLAGYNLQGSTLIKDKILPLKVETYLKKEDLDHYRANLQEGEGWVRQLVQNARGLPIMATITAYIRKMKESKSSFFIAQSPVQFIKIEGDSYESNRLICIDLGIVKTYNNTHVLTESPTKQLLTNPM